MTLRLQGDHIIGMKKFQGFNWSKSSYQIYENFDKHLAFLRKSFCDTLGTAKILCSSNIGFLIIHLQNLKPIHLRAAQSINIFSMLMLLTLHLLWSSIFFPKQSHKELFRHGWPKTKNLKKTLARTP